MTKYSFRCIKASWGISIDILADCKQKSLHEKKEFVNLAPGLWATILCNNIPDDEMEFLWKGLQYVGNSIINNSPFRNDTLIVIYSIEYNYCDFQPEGLLAAIIGWAAQEFQFKEPDVNIFFDIARNKYVFNF